MRSYKAIYNVSLPAPMKLLCPGCGVPEAVWAGMWGLRYIKGRKVYCCEGCAIGHHCVCGEKESA